MIIADDKNGNILELFLKFIDVGQSVTIPSVLI